MPRIADAFARLWPRAATAPEAKASATAALIAFERLGEPVWSPRDVGSFAREGFMQNAIVYRCVRMISEAAAAIPLLLYEGDTEIETHPFLDLMRQPSYDQTTADFLESWYGFLLVAGNAYVEAVGLDGRLRELHVLRPDRMKVVPGPSGWPEGFEYTLDGATHRFDSEPVPGVRPILHVRLFHPLNDYYGMSPIEAAAVAIDIHNAAARWNKALLDNAARPSGALVYAARDGKLTDDQFARLKSELETSFQGARNAGRPMLLEGGLDWKALSMSPKDMDFIEAKNGAAREIALAMGVPPMLLGIPGDNTYSNFQEASRAFWRQTVLPLVNRTSKALSMWLSPAYGAPLSLRPDLDQVDALASERDALWARLDKATFLTPNEKRTAAGYPSHEGGDELKFAAGQARMPAGNGRESGRWITGDGGFGVAPDGTPVEPTADRSGSSYDPAKRGWHDYTSGPNLVCPAALQCSAQEVADQLARFAVPGQNPAEPAQSGKTYLVTDPWTEAAPGGYVETSISNDGLTVVNRTLPLHVFYDGLIERRAEQGADGSWSVTTHGIGNNVVPGFATVNQWSGPKIFDALDQRMKDNIQRHHGR